MNLCRLTFKFLCNQQRQHITNILTKNLKSNIPSIKLSDSVRKLTTMKLDNKDFHELFSPELKKLTEIFQKYQFELRIAGGAVRDLLMNLKPQDIDFATTATPEEMKTFFQKEEIRLINTKGEKHGTITARINDKENFEVTTLRIDVRTDGRHAEVEWTRDWKLDALRRDLTINSLFLGFDGTVYDYFNGIEDLANKKVCFVGTAEDRIQEDYLRILRYFRFYGRIATDPDAHEPATLQSIKENMSGLKGISGERLWVEIKKILTGNHAVSLLPLMLDLGMGQFIGLHNKPNIEEYQKICKRSFELNPDPMTLLAALLNAEDEVYALHDRVKMSREELRLGLFIINHRSIDMGENPFRRCQDIYCDTVGKETRNKEKICQLLVYLNEREALKEFSEWTPPKFPVSGHKLLERGVNKGPKLAKALHELRQMWKQSAFTLTEDELLDLVEEVKKKL